MRIPFNNLKFFYEGNEVGLFIRFKYPTKDGEYRYEPYRGFGHLKMLEKIKDIGIATCFYINGNEKFFFDVRNSGKPAKLLLSNFRKEIIQN